MIADMIADGMADRLLIGDRTGGLTATDLRAKATAGATFMNTTEMPVVARMLDDAGHDGIITSDHLIRPDPWVLIGAMAAVTTRVRRVGDRAASAGAGTDPVRRRVRARPAAGRSVLRRLGRGRLPKLGGTP